MERLVVEAKNIVKIFKNSKEKIFHMEKRR